MKRLPYPSTQIIPLNRENPSIGVWCSSHRKSLDGYVGWHTTRHLRVDALTVGGRHGDGLGSSSTNCNQTTHGLAGPVGYLLWHLLVLCKTMANPEAKREGAKRKRRPIG